MSEAITVHLMTMGLTQEHVWPIIDKYKPFHIVLLSSKELAVETEELAEKIRERGIKNAEVVHLEPFTNNALNDMVTTIQLHLERLEEQYKYSGPRFYMGVTGGTNLMVLAAGLVAINNGITLLYVLNPAFSPEQNAAQQEIIEINPESLK